MEMNDVLDAGSLVVLDAGSLAKLDPANCKRC